MKDVTLEAVLFDVDGTLADTERDGHRPAFNAAFAEHGLDVVWTPQHYGRLLAITGGRRRIAHDLSRRGYRTAERLAADIHLTKTALFRDAILDGTITPRPGVRQLVDDLTHGGIRIGVVTTGRRAWVQPLLEHLLPGVPIQVTITGDDVQRLKPDGEAYLRALQEMALTPRSALAIEDSAVGLRAARSAGVATVVVRNDYTARQDFTGAAQVRDEFDGSESLRADGCRRIHSEFWKRADQK